MAKKSGKDEPHYIGGGGRIVASPGFGSEDGFGTPPHPGERGEAYGGHVADGLKTPGKHGGIFKRMKGGK